MAKELTLDEAKAIIETLKAENTEQKTKIETLTSEKEQLSQKLEIVAKDHMILSKEVPGTFEYKSKDEDTKHLNGIYKFKKGVLGFSIKNKRIESEKAIKDKAQMIELIEMEAGVIEKVDESKE